jgi:hypothetical protein
MNEIIKLIADYIAANFTVEGIRKIQAEKRKRKVSVSLFQLFISLNEVYTLGMMIIDELEAAEERVGRHVAEGSQDSEMHYAPFKYLLDQQYVSLLRTVRALTTLQKEVQILAPEAYAKLIPLLHGKLTLLGIILSKSRSSDAFFPSIAYFPDSGKALEDFLQRLQDAKLIRIHRAFGHQHADWDYSRLERKLDGVDLEEEIKRTINLQQLHPRNDWFGADDLPWLRECLKSAPRQRLEQIKGALTEFRTALINVYPVADIIAEVGEAPGAEGMTIKL